MIPVGETSGVFARVAKRGVWQKLAQAVDAYCARRFERTVSDIALRRSKREIARCRQLVQNLPRCASEVTPAGAAALGPVLGGAMPDHWVAREAEGRTGGVFLLKQSALHFAQRKSAPVGCATMFLAEPIELDTENLGNPLVRWIDAALSRLNQFIPAYPPVIPIKEEYRKGDWQ